MKVVLPMTLEPVLVLVFFIVTTVAKDEAFSDLGPSLETGVLIVVGPVSITCLNADTLNVSKEDILKMY